MIDSDAVRLWPGRPAVDLDGLFLWVDAAGDPVLMRRADGRDYAVASGNASIDAADAPSGSRPVRPASAAELAGLIPPGAGLVVGLGTAAPAFATGEQVDAMRPGPVPHGDEPELRLAPAPYHLGPLIAAARAAGRRAGVKRVHAAWASFPGGAPVLILLPKTGSGPSSADALDAVYAAVVEQAPAERVRVVPSSLLPAHRRMQIASAQQPQPGPRMVSTNGFVAYRSAPQRGLQPRDQQRADVPRNGKSPERPTRARLVVALSWLGAVAGSLMITLARRLSMPGWTRVTLLVAGVIVLTGFVGAALHSFFGRE